MKTPRVLRLNDGYYVYKKPITFKNKEYLDDFLIERKIKWRFKGTDTRVVYYYPTNKRVFLWPNEKPKSYSWRIFKDTGVIITDKPIMVLKCRRNQ